MHRTVVADVMATELVTAPPHASFAHLARLLHTAGVRAVPVVDPAGVLLGVVSEADLMASAARPDTEPGRWRARRVRRDQPEAKAGATTTVELMTPFVEAVAPTTTVATAARLMVEHHLRWMPVCDDAGGVVGVISRSDLLAVFLRDDESMHTEVLEEVLAHAQGADAKGVQVDVRDGVVTLAGEVATRGDAERLVRSTERVEGAVAVVDTSPTRWTSASPTPGRRRPAESPRGRSSTAAPQRPCRYSSGQHLGDPRGSADQAGRIATHDRSGAVVLDMEPGVRPAGGPWGVSTGPTAG